MKEGLAELCSSVSNAGKKLNLFLLCPLYPGPLTAIICLHTGLNYALLFDSLDLKKNGNFIKVNLQALTLFSTKALMLGETSFLSILSRW